MDLFYASHFGHTQRIAQTLADAIVRSGPPVRLRNLAEEEPGEAELRSLDPCVLISPIRYGVPLAKARRLLKRIAPLTPQKPLVLICVNLTARKPGRDSATGNVYLRRWIERSGAKPRLAEAIAGKLEYPRYNVFDRTMIRLIMTMTGGPTDGATVIDYTSWPRVAELGAEIAAAISARGANPGRVADEA